MSGLAEVSGVLQIPDQPRRRWFWSRALDLIVWLNRNGSPLGFQLCYDKHGAERVLTWTPQRGYSHMAVDDGEAEAGLRYKGTPILVADGEFDAARVLQAFQVEGSNIPREIAAFVTEKLEGHPSYPAGA
jgi:hypothetical protein